MESPAFRVITSNRLEALADRLAARLVAPAADAARVLAPTTIVVPHAGLGQWLEQRFCADFGIAAHWRFPLPERFLWQWVGRLHGEVGQRSPFAREVLVWRLWRVLATLPKTPVFGPLQEFVDGADDRRRWPLARRLAELFDRYLVMRPDWLAAWENDDDIGAREHPWQPALWRLLRAEVDLPHRARLLEMHARALDAGSIAPSDLPEHVHFFGVATLPPAELRWFEALARHVPVDFYVPAPSREWWADFGDRRALARAAVERARHRGDVEGVALDARHPLLENLGALGRDFQALLYAEQGPASVEDLWREPEANHLLARLQRSLLDADATVLAQAPAPTHDASIALHRAHSPLREVEVLHDALLARFNHDPSLTPRDVVVLCPDLHRYAPLVRAVFGAASGERRIPFHLADTGVRERHALIAAYLRVFELDAARFTVSEVLSWWEQPAARARFSVDAAARERLEHWLAAVGAHWGVDAAFRAAVGSAPDAQGSLRRALDRLLLGYALGSETRLIGEVAPWSDLEGQGTQVLGPFVELVSRLLRLRDGLGRARTAREWQQVLLAAFDDLFDARENEEIAARAALRDALARLLADAEEAGLSGPIEGSVIRDWLTRELAADDGRAPWLGGGVCVCGMVPLRSVPFRVIAVLGLDDGVFPRQALLDGLDLTRAAPRAGDRALADDDRYLFLEAVLSARDHLHLSWVGYEARDGAERPPSTVVGELRGLLRDQVFAGDGAALSRCIEYAHPVSPGDARAFTDPRAPSFAREWLPSATAARGERFMVPIQDADDPDDVSLRELRDYLRSPSNYWLDRLQARVPPDDLPSDEDLDELDGLDAHQALQWLVTRAWQDVSLDAARATREMAARDLLPSGAAGAAIASDLIAPGMELAMGLRNIEASPVLDTWRAIDLRLDAGMLRGEVRVSAQGDIVLVRKAMRGGRLLGAFVEWLALLAQGQASRLIIGAMDGPSGARLALLEPPSDPRATLETCVRLVRRARRCLPGWAPNSSCAAAELLLDEKPDKALDAARSSWNDAYDRPGEGSRDAWPLVARGWSPLEEPEFLDLAAASFTPLLRALREQT